MKAILVRAKRGIAVIPVEGPLSGRMAIPRFARNDKRLGILRYIGTADISYDISERQRISVCGTTKSGLAVARDPAIVAGASTLTSWAGSEVADAADPSAEVACSSRATWSTWSCSWSR